MAYTFIRENNIFILPNKFDMVFTLNLRGSDG